MWHYLRNIRRERAFSVVGHSPSCSKSEFCSTYASRALPTIFTAYQVPTQVYTASPSPPTGFSFCDTMLYYTYSSLALYTHAAAVPMHTTIALTNAAANPHLPPRAPRRELGNTNNKTSSTILHCTTLYAVHFNSPGRKSSSLLLTASAGVLPAGVGPALQCCCTYTVVYTRYNTTVNNGNYRNLPRVNSNQNYWVRLATGTYRVDGLGLGLGEARCGAEVAARQLVRNAVGGDDVLLALQRHVERQNRFHVSYL